MNVHPRIAALVAAAILAAGCGDGSAPTASTEPALRLAGHQRSFLFEVIDREGHSYLLDVTSLPTFTFRKEPIQQEGAAEGAPARARLSIEVLGAPSGTVTAIDGAHAEAGPEVTAVFRYHFPSHIGRGSAPGFDDPSCHLNPSDVVYAAIPPGVVCDVVGQSLASAVASAPARLVNTEIEGDDATIDTLLERLRGATPYVRVSILDRFGTHLDGRCYVVVAPDGTLLSVADNRCAVGPPGEVAFSPPPVAPECPPAEGGSDTSVRAFSASPPMCLEPEVEFLADLETNFGLITVRLDPEWAENTVNNFVFLARHRFFDDTVCHRAIPGFMVQCGDPLGTGVGGPGYQIADELPGPGEYQVGSVAMANAGPDTGGSQFFIVTGPQGVGLPPAYSLFGQVIEGFDVLEAIDAVGNPADNGVPPLESIQILSVRIRAVVPSVDDHVDDPAVPVDDPADDTP